MANASISFNGDKIIRELDLNVQTQLPFLASLTLNRLAWQVRIDAQAEMQRAFKRVTPYTLNSFVQLTKSTKSRLYTDVGHLGFAGKGNSASNYLRPQIYGGEVYKTRFQYRMQKKTGFGAGNYMMPMEDSPAAKRNAQGRIRASQYVEALYGIKAMNDLIARAAESGDKRADKIRARAEGKYLYAPPNGRNLGISPKYYHWKGKALAGGIYRIVKNEAVQLFRQLDNIPTVEDRYEFVDTIELSVIKNADRIFQQAVKERANR